ncbi:molecular chaperone TorD family protein [Bacillaceae bacterium S4-13-56]
MDQNLNEMDQERSRIYELFGRLWLELPQKELVVQSQEGFWKGFPVPVDNDQMTRGIDELLKWSEASKNYSVEETVTELRSDYAKLFIGPATVEAPPWESVYRSKRKNVFGLQTYAVRDFFHRFGLELTRKNQEPDDHIGLELLFMSYLIDCISNQKFEEQELIKAQSQFLEEHILTWISDFSNDVQKNANTPFYKGLALLCEGFVTMDKQNLQVLI